MLAWQRTAGGRDAKGLRDLRTVATALLLLAMQGCGESAEERRDVGYDDGFAVGYNTACKIRATLVEGDWKSKPYSEAYRQGYADGERECLRPK